MKLLVAILSGALALFSVTGAQAQDFPVTVTHERGDTTIPATPERIVSVGLHEQDFLYALGLAPVGVHEWWGDYPYATWPWANAAREAVGATPEVMKGFEINVEWVAAQRPDLIVATYYGDLDDATYELLSQIAPTITAPAGFPGWGAPWQDELRLIGTATGTSAKAEEIIAGIDARFAAVRRRFFLKRGGCCRYYTADNAESCTTCILRPEAEQVARLTAYLSEGHGLGQAAE